MNLNTPSNTLLPDLLRQSLDRLHLAQSLMKQEGWAKSYTTLYTAICDAMTATQDAVDRLNDAPNDDTPGALLVCPKVALVIPVVSASLADE